MYTNQTRPAATPPSVSRPTIPKESPAHTPQHEGLRSTLTTVAILLIAPLIAVLLTAFVFQSYQVEGDSMVQTLHHNDRLIVWKVPKTWSKITGNNYIPNRGDIIVFTEPELRDFNLSPSKQLIKRVIGLPGERVVISKRVVTVYNEQHPDGFHPDTDLPYHRTAEDTVGDIDTLVGEGEVFVLGDNRTNSLDSRSFGPVRSDHIVGKLILRVLPIGDMKPF